MINISVGCAGYSYDDWKGGFYPQKLPRSEFFAYYAKFFDFTEVNSTYYQPPSENMVNHWLKNSPENFRFALKMWREVTPLGPGTDPEPMVRRFFKPLSPIQSKISAILLQYPPKYKNTPAHLTMIENTMGILPRHYRYVLEFRHASWFGDGAPLWGEKYSNVSLGTSYMDKIDPYYVPGQRIYYIRAIGDRTLTAFNRRQRKMQEAWDHLVVHAKEMAEKSDITDLFVIFNNHFSGFSPEDVAEFKKEMGMKQRSFKIQRDLTEFF